MSPHGPKPVKRLVLAILLLTGHFVKVARGSLLRTTERLIIGCGLCMNKEQNVADIQRMWLIVSAACNREITVLLSEEIFEISFSP